MLITHLYLEFREGCIEKSLYAPIYGKNLASNSEIFKSISTSKDEKITIIVIIPSNAFQNPESYGGGYVRFIKSKKYLSKYFDFIPIKYSCSKNSGIISYLSAFLIPIFSLKLAREKQVNAVLIHGFFSDAFAGCVLAKLLKLKLIVFANSAPLKGHIGFPVVGNISEGAFSGIWSLINTVKRNKLLAFMEALVLYKLLLCLRNAVVVPLAPCLSADLKSLGLNLIPIYPGVGCDQPSSEASKRWIDALYVASPLHPQKGVFDVIEVWRKIIKSRPDAKMIIAGREDPLFNIRILKEKIRSENIEKNITVIAKKEAVPNSVILRLMSQAKVFVYPSRKDVCPLVIGEALSRGTPVVTYDLPGIQFAYGSCEAVIRVPVGDTDAMAAKVLEILENPRLAERLRQAAVDWCKANPWSKVALKEAKAYLLSLLGAIEYHA
jgi:glycosyltransferase involved in cell wall biosynthesis